MGAMFRSTESAVFVFEIPRTMTLPAVFSDPIDMVLSTPMANIGLFLVDGAGTTVVNAVQITSLPVGFSYENDGFMIVIEAAPSILAANAAGTWRGYIRDLTTPIQHTAPVAYCQWGGTVDLLTQTPVQVANNMISDGSTYASSVTPVIRFNAFVNPATGLHEGNGTTSAQITFVNPLGAVTTPATSYIASTGTWTASPAAYSQGQWQASISQVIDGVTYTMAGSFFWGVGSSIIAAQTTAQSARVMLNNGESVIADEEAKFTFPLFIDPATGLPDTTLPVLNLFGPGGQNYTSGVSAGFTIAQIGGAGPLWIVTGLPTALLAVLPIAGAFSGRWYAILTTSISGVIYTSTGYVDWGPQVGPILSTNTNISVIQSEQVVTNTFLGKGRLFQYKAGDVVKSKIWLRTPDGTAWAGYFPAYGNSTTGGVWPPAVIVWPTTWAAVTGSDELVIDPTGPT